MSFPTLESRVEALEERMDNLCNPPAKLKPHRTHAEIMRNWFKIPKPSIDTIGWNKVSAFDDNKINNVYPYYFIDDWCKADYFDTLEMKTQEEIEAME